MIILVYAFASFLVIAGLILVIKPGVIFHFLDRNSGNLWLYVSAIAARIVLGGLLIYVASASRYPLVISIIGWITLLAALAFTVIGWSRFRALLGWVLSRAESFGRAGGVMSVFLGLFLIYAF